MTLARRSWFEKFENQEREWGEAVKVGTPRGARLHETLTAATLREYGVVHDEHCCRVTLRAGRLTGSRSWCVCGSPSSLVYGQYLLGVVFVWA